MSTTTEGNVMSSRTLPAPHGSISVSIERFAWGACVEYVGPSLEALREAGCIDEATYNEYAANPRRRLCAWPQHECWRRNVYSGKRAPTAIRIRHKLWDEAKARALPGVREALEGAPATPRALRVDLAQLARVGLETEVLRKKQRAVGRFQRLVEYVTCENLIVPNWSELVGARFASAEK